MKLITPNNGKIVAEWMTEDDLELVVFSKNPQLDLISLGNLIFSLFIFFLFIYIILLFRHLQIKDVNTTTYVEQKSIERTLFKIAPLLLSSLRLLGLPYHLICPCTN